MSTSEDSYNTGIMEGWAQIVEMIDTLRSSQSFGAGAMMLDKLSTMIEEDEHKGGER